MELTLYGYWRSTSSWRVRIGLHLKGLAFTYRAVDLRKGEQRDAAHLARNPTSQVPVLAVSEGGETRHLVQSMAILEFLDERFPSPPLLPPDPYGRARVRALAEHVNSGIQPYQNLAALTWLKAKLPDGDKQWASHWIRLGLAALERAVRDGAGRFCHGDAPTLADAYLVPQLYAARRFALDLEAYPTLLAVERACGELEAFRRAEPDAQPDAPPPDRRT